MQHALFWISYVVFFGLIYGKYENDYVWYFLESACMLPFIMFATYMAIYVFIPRYLAKRKIVPLILFMVITLFVSTLLERAFLRIINKLPITVESLFNVTFVYLFLETNFMVGGAMAIKLVKKWFEQQQAGYEIEKQSLQNELDVLKAQLHPHFLFNTMNNLYALSLEKSSKTSEGIIKISELLRSVLYDCNESEITLKKEIKLIENFIELERMRYSNRLTLDFIIEGDIEGIKIAPMILFTFVENCFKHGSSTNPGNPWIKIKLLVDGCNLSFVAQNSFVSGSNKSFKSDNKNGHSGIGLSNVKKRLGLIYKDRHQLTISEKENMFEVKLEIFCK